MERQDGGLTVTSHIGHWMVSIPSPCKDDTCPPPLELSIREVKQPEAGSQSRLPFFTGERKGARNSETSIQGTEAHVLLTIMKTDCESDHNQEAPKMSPVLTLWCPALSCLQHRWSKAVPLPPFWSGTWAPSLARLLCSLPLNMSRGLPDQGHLMINPGSQGSKRMCYQSVCLCPISGLYFPLLIWVLLWEILGIKRRASSMLATLPLTYIP